MVRNFEREYKKRINKEVKYICKYGYTIREVAAEMQISKSTVHLDVTIRLQKYSDVMYQEVREVLDEHLATWHIKGGLATREKYLRMKMK